MFRRIVAITVFVILVAAVSLLVHWNAAPTSFKLTPELTFNLPLGILMIAAAVAGALVMFVLALMREGRLALRDWSVHREIRIAQRNAAQITEARSQILAGEYKRARNLLTKSTQKRAMEISDIIDFAETYLLEGDPLQARKVLEEAQKDFGNEPLLLFALGRACKATGDLPAATSALERAVSVYPTSMPILTVLRDILFETESWERAAEVQGRIVELNADDASEKNWLLGARYEAALQAEDSARDAALREIASDAPDFLPVLVHRAKNLAATGDWRRAMKILEKAVRKKPHGATLDELERMVPAEESSRLARLYGKLVASSPQSVGLRLRAAHYLIKHGRVEEAAETLTPLADGTEASVAKALWGEIHDAREESTLAHSSYREALSDSEAFSPQYNCEVCEAATRDWHARCDNCGAWGMFESI